MKQFPGFLARHKRGVMLALVVYMKRTGITTVFKRCCVLMGICALAVSCSKSRPSFEEAHRAAIEKISSRALWPESPEALCKAFWAARTQRNYRELEVLWPGSASSDWKALCRVDDTKVRYVFGPFKDGKVPYASEEYYRQHGSYNLTMRLSSMETPRGKRYYVWSGN